MNENIKNLVDALKQKKGNSIWTYLYPDNNKLEAVFTMQDSTNIDTIYIHVIIRINSITYDNYLVIDMDNNNKCQLVLNNKMKISNDSLLDAIHNVEFKNDIPKESQTEARKNKRNYYSNAEETIYPLTLEHRKREPENEIKIRKYAPKLWELIKDLKYISVRFVSKKGRTFDQILENAIKRGII